MRQTTFKIQNWCFKTSITLMYTRYKYRITKMNKMWTNDVCKLAIDMCIKTQWFCRVSILSVAFLSHNDIPPLRKSNKTQLLLFTCLWSWAVMKAIHNLNCRMHPARDIIQTHFNLWRIQSRHFWHLDDMSNRLLSLRSHVVCNCSHQRVQWLLSLFCGWTL